MPDASASTPSYDELWVREPDLATIGSGFDSQRTFHSLAPGAHAFAQSRWSFEGFSIDAAPRTIRLSIEASLHVPAGP